MIIVSKGKLGLLVFLVFFLSLYIVAPVLSIRGIQPDLWVLLLLFYAFRVNWKKMPFFAFFIGLLKDFLSTRFFGLETFSLGILAILLSYVMGKVEREDPVTFVVSAFLFSLFYEWMLCAGFVITSGSYTLLPYFFLRSFWSAVYTVAVFPPAFLVFQFFTEERRFSDGGAFR